MRSGGGLVVDESAEGVLEAAEDRGVAQDVDVDGGLRDARCPRRTIGAGDPWPSGAASSWAHLPPYGVGVVPTTANGLPLSAPSP